MVHTACHRPSSQGSNLSVNQSLAQLQTLFDGEYNLSHLKSLHNLPQPFHWHNRAFKQLQSGVQVKA